MAARRSARALIASTLAADSRNIQVVNPNLGLYLDRARHSIPDRGMSSCLNVRVRNGRITNERMGRRKFVDTPIGKSQNNTVGDPVTLITNYRNNVGGSTLIVGSKNDLAQYDEGNSRLAYLTPIEATGDVSILIAPATTVTGAGGADFVTSGIKAGDMLHFGSATQTSAEAPWWEIASITDATHLELVAYTGAAQTNVVYTIRKVFSGIEADRWSADTFPVAQPANVDLFIATNGDDIVSWDNVAAQVTVQSLGFTCKSVRFYKNQMYYANIEEGGVSKPTNFKNSDQAQPFVLTGGTAGELNAVTGTDAVLKMEILGDHIVMLAERSINVVEFVGDPLGHTVRTVLHNIGPFAAELVTNHGDFLEFLSHDRAYRFDGVGKAEFGSQVFREVLRTTAPDRAWQSNAFRDTEEGEVQWVVALMSDFSLFPEVSHTEHYVEQVGGRDPTPMTKRELAAVSMGSFTRTGALRFSDFSSAPQVDPFDQQTARWNDRELADDAPLTIIGDKDGDLYQICVSTSDDGADLTSFAFFGLKPAWDGQTKGRIRTVEPWVEIMPGSIASMNVTVNTYDGPEGVQLSSRTVLFPLDQSGKRRLPFGKGGRFYEVGYGITAVDEVWSISGWDVESVPTGAL